MAKMFPVIRNNNSHRLKPLPPPSVEDKHGRIQSATSLVWVGLKQLKLLHKQLELLQTLASWQQHYMVRAKAECISWKNGMHTAQSLAQFIFNTVKHWPCKNNNIKVQH